MTEKEKKAIARNNSITQSGALSYRDLQRLNEVYGGQGESPSAPDMNLVRRQKAQQVAESSFGDFGRNYIQSEASRESGGKNYFGKSKYDKGVSFVGDDVSRDMLQDSRYDNQSTVDVLANGVAKAGGRTFTTAVNGSIGLLAGIGESIYHGDTSYLWNNKVSQAMKELDDYMEENFTNYRSVAQEQAPWYDPRYWGAAGFADNFVANAGFMLGANMSMGLVSGIAGKVAALKRMQDLGKMLGLSSKFGRGVSNLVSAWVEANGEAGIEAIGASQEYLQLETERFKTRWKQEQAQTMQDIEDEYQNNLANGEWIEVFDETTGQKKLVNNAEEIRNRRLADLKNKYDAGLKNIQEQAKKVGQNTYRGNVFVLTLSNLITWGKSMGENYDASRRASEIIDKANGANLIGSTKANVAQGAREAQKALAKGASTKTGDIVRMKKGLEHGLDIFDNTKAGVLSKRFLSEGVWEEGMQGAVSTASKMNATKEDVDDYWRMTYDPDKVERGESWFSSLGEAMGIQYGTAEGLQEVVIGGVSGTAGMYAFGRGSKKSDGSERAWYDPRRYGGWNSVYDDYQDFKKRKDNAQKNSDALNQMWQSEETWRAINNMAAMENHIQSREDAAREGNKKKYKDEDAKVFARFVQSASRAGRIDVVREAVKSAWTEMSDEEIDRLVEDASPEVGIGDQRVNFVRNAQGQIAELDKEIAASQKKLAQETKNTDSRKAKIAALEQEVANLRGYTDIPTGQRGSTQDIEARQNEINRLEDEISAIESSSMSKKQQKKEIKSRKGVIDRLHNEISSLSAPAGSVSGLNKKNRAALKKAEDKLHQLQRVAGQSNDRATALQSEIDAFNSRKQEIQNRIDNTTDSDFTPFRDDSSGWVDKFGNRVKTNDEIREQFKKAQESFLADIDAWKNSADWIGSVTEGKLNNDQEDHLTYLHYLYSDKIKRNADILTKLRSKIPSVFTLDINGLEGEADLIKSLKGHAVFGERLTEDPNKKGVFKLDTRGLEDAAFVNAFNMTIFDVNKATNSLNIKDIMQHLRDNAIKDWAQNGRDTFDAINDLTDALNLYKDSKEFQNTLNTYLKNATASTENQVNEVNKARKKKASKDANKRSANDWVTAAKSGENLDDALNTEGLTPEAIDNIKKAKDILARQNNLNKTISANNEMSEENKAKALAALEEISKSLEDGDGLTDGATWEQYSESMELDPATVSSVMNNPNLTDEQKQQALQDLKRQQGKDILDMLLEADEEYKQSSASQEDMQVADEIAQVAEKAEREGEQIPETARDGAEPVTPMPTVSTAPVASGETAPTAQPVVVQPAPQERPQPIKTHTETSETDLAKQEKIDQENTTTEPTSSGSRLYWKSNTTETALFPNSLGDNRPYHEQTDSPNKALYEKIHKFLLKNGAFTRINSEEVKIGTKLRIGTNRELNEETGTVVPLLYMQDSQGEWVVVGDMMSMKDSNLESFKSYVNYESFLKGLEERYSKDSESAEIIVPLDLEVRDMLNGKPMYTAIDSRHSLNEIFQNQPFKIAIKTGNMAHPLIIDSDEIGSNPTELERSVQTPLSGNPGQPYILIKSAKGYVAVPFSMPRYNGTDPRVMNTRLGQQAKAIMERLEKAGELTDEASYKKLMRDFQNMFSLEHFWVYPSKTGDGQIEISYKMHGETKMTTVTAPKEQIAAYVRDYLIPAFTDKLGFQIDAFRMNTPEYNSLIGELAEANIEPGRTHTVNDFPVFDYVSDNKAMEAISPTASASASDSSIVVGKSNVDGVDIPGVLITETGVFVPTGNFNTFYAYRTPEGIKVARATSKNNSIAKMSSKKTVSLDVVGSSTTIEVPINQVVGWMYGRPEKGYTLGINEAPITTVAGVGDDSRLFEQNVQGAMKQLIDIINNNGNIATAVSTEAPVESSTPAQRAETYMGEINSVSVYFNPITNEFTDKDGAMLVLNDTDKSVVYCKYHNITTPTVTPFTPEGAKFNPETGSFESAKPKEEAPASTPDDVTPAITGKTLSPAERQSYIKEIIRGTSMQGSKKTVTKILENLTDEQLDKLHAMDFKNPHIKNMISDFFLNNKETETKQLQENFDKLFEGNHLLLEESVDMDDSIPRETPMSIDELTSIINASSSSLSDTLTQKILNVAKELGLEVSLGHTDLGRNVAGVQQGKTIKIAAWATSKQRVADGTAAHAIMHELIHGVTEYVIDAYEDGTLQDEALIKAVKTLKACYEIAKKNTTLAKEYGLTNLKEMIAELSNRRFRERAKKVGLWNSIKNAIKSIFTRNTVDRRLEEALDTILNNYDTNLFKQQTSNNGNYNVNTAAIQKEMDDIKQKAIEDGTFMKAPNGADTNLTERQWLQVRTKAFKDWFGDWETAHKTRNYLNVSKVIDENGEPMVMVHGSPVNITAFDRKFTSPNGSSGRGFYFGRAPKDPNAPWSYGIRHDSFLNVKNFYNYFIEKEKDSKGHLISPLTMNVIIGADNYEQFLNDASVKLHEDYYKNITKKIFKKLHDKYNGKGVVTTKQGEVKRLFRSNIKYGLIDTNHVGEVVVRDPTQIKSATDNVGTFSKDDDRINYLKFKESQGEFYNEADNIEKMPMNMRIQRAKWSNISAEDRQILNDMGVTPQIWQNLNLEQREEMLRCAF